MLQDPNDKTLVVNTSEGSWVLASPAPSPHQDDQSEVSPSKTNLSAWTFSPTGQGVPAFNFTPKRAFKFKVDSQSEIAREDITAKKTNGSWFAKEKESAQDKERRFPRK